MQTYPEMLSVEQTDSVDDLAAALASRTARVGVIGLGYVGLPLALMLSDQGFPVTGFDLDMLRIAKLSGRDSYLQTVSNEWVGSARTAGFSATIDMSVLATMDVIIICVPTPINDRCDPDLGALVASANQIAQHLRPGQLVILQSTSFPGTTDEVLIPILEKNNRLGLSACREDPAREDEFLVAFSPEREDPGNTEFARCSIPKVVGGLTPETSKLTSDLYQTVFNRVVNVSGPKAAEMAKLLENSYRFVNIGLINEVKVLCEKMKIDVWEVIGAASTKPFGFHAFFPGPGIGGHCIPVDPLYLAWKAKEFDCTMRSIEVAREINCSMPIHVVDSIRDCLNQQGKSLKDSQVLLLGAAYKKNIDDVRESPFFKIFERLSRAGCVVSYHDPHVPTVRISAEVDLNSVPLSDLAQYDAVVLLTDHSVFDCAEIAETSRLLIDTRGATRGLHSKTVVRC
jgi:UDP-N-acetyl-D-glucosamine dehydrogenase